MSVVKEVSTSSSRPQSAFAAVYTRCSSQQELYEIIIDLSSLFKMALKATNVYICFALGIIILYIIWSMLYYLQYGTELDDTVEQALFYGKMVNKQESGDTMKYILQWTLPNTIPFIYMDVGQETFIKRNCSVTNCFVTSNRSLLKHLTDFDVIAFHGPELVINKKIKLPKERSPHQKYVFVSLESSHYYPVCNNYLDGFFNWTWTYKLKSDEPFGYITVRNKEGDIIGPKEIMHWKELKDMEPIDEDLKAKLQNKSKAAAWFVSNCNALSKRQEFVELLQQDLKKYGLTIDIFGKCGTHTCAFENMNDCLKIIERDYYFYLSLENSFSEDYVTEKLLHALQHYAVPIVYGDANYTRFMPHGIYLNGMDLKVRELAKQMYDIIQNEEKYYELFKWHNYYSFHSREEAPDTDDYCQFCAMINDENLMNETTVYKDFKTWWTSPWICP